MNRTILLIGSLCIALLGCDSGDGGTRTPLEQQASTPTFSPVAATYTAAQTVSLSDNTFGASVYYTTNGSTPSIASILYSASAPIAISSTTTIKAIAVATGYTNSDVAVATYTINLPTAATPTFSPIPATYASAQSLTLSDATSGASIYYTTNGTTPTISSTLYSSPISVSSTTTIEAMAVAPGYANSVVASGTFTFVTVGPTVSVVLSTHDQTQLLAVQPSVNFTLGNTADAGTNTVIVDPTQTYQAIDGFGAAFTDSAAYLLNEVAPPSALTSTMNDLFARDGNGIGLSFMRNPIGGSDLARYVYSFDDQPVGTTDLDLAHFSIAHDQTDIIPIILQAKALNPNMKIVAAPWSPPGWMKDPASMNPVSMLGGSLLMTSANETAYAKYFVKYLQAYQAAGITFDYLSLQNEPQDDTAGTYPGMWINDSDQLALLQNYVLPALASNSISTKVLVFDNLWTQSFYPQHVLAGLTTQQLTHVAGTAWHGYQGSAGAMQLLANQYPTLGNWMTELSGGWVNDQFATDMQTIIWVMRNQGKGFIKWSLALDENLGPNLARDAGLGGCTTCTPLVTVNSSTGAITKGIEFYTLGQFSKFVLPGAVNIYSSNTPAIASAAFVNPDGSMVLIAYNNSSSSQTFPILWGTESFSYTLPAKSAATFAWAGTVFGSLPPVEATAQIQGSSYSSEFGLESEFTGDSTGEYDLGSITDGAYAVYNNIDFGTGVRQLSVRSAGAGTGGSATFYLDSMTGMPIATAGLPVTGGGQTWTTVTANVSGATGVHKLYVVFHGSGSISSVNWFQFTE